jgi:hypothetical protein
LFHPHLDIAILDQLVSLVQPPTAIMSSEESKAAHDGNVTPQLEVVDPNMGTDHRDFSVFTVNQRRAIVSVGSLAAFFSPLSSSIYFPALDTVAKALGVSVTKVNLTVTTYLVSGSAPLVENPPLTVALLVPDPAGNCTHVDCRFLRHCR